MANKAPTKAQAEEFDMLWPILKSLLTETKELSKKKADNPLNKLKVGMINKVLERVKKLLASDPTIQFLELLTLIALTYHQKLGYPKIHVKILLFYIDWLTVHLQQE